MISKKAKNMMMKKVSKKEKRKKTMKISVKKVMTMKN